MYLWYSKKKEVNFGNPRHKNTVLGSVLCRHDREMSAKSANIWLSGRHVADMLPTFPAKTIAQRQYPQCSHCSGCRHHPPHQHRNQMTMALAMAKEAMVTATRVAGEQWRQQQHAL
jgi:hypothetical protein